MAKVKTKKLSFVPWVISLLEGALKLSHAFERLLVDVVVGYVPLFAPIIPASLAFDNLLNVLNMGFWVSLIGAAVVEFLGLGTVTTVTQFVDYNASRGEGDPRAPITTAVLVTGFYLVVVLTVNVLLDDSEFIERFSKLLLSTLSVAGALTISLRSQHSRRVAEKVLRDEKAVQKAIDDAKEAFKQQQADARRQERHELKKMALELGVSANGNGKVKVSGKVSESNSETPATFGKYQSWRQLPTNERKLIVEEMRKNGDAKIITMKWICTRYGTSERVAYGWIDYAVRDFPELMKEGAR